MSHSVWSTRPSVRSQRAVAAVDLDAYAHNIASLKMRIGNAQLMAVVKADAYGHNAIACAFAARRAGADWLGVAFVDEALALREAGDRGPLLAWLLSEGDDLVAAVQADIDISVVSIEQLEALVSAYPAGERPRVHIEVDTGLSRGGAAEDSWLALFTAAAKYDVVSIWSHLACADDPEHPANAAQHAQFLRALAVAEECGVTPRLRHLANSAATLTRPDFHFDLVRVGMASYGVSPMDDDATAYDLRPVMTVRANVAHVREVPAGAGVSYGHRYVTVRPTRLALVPLGYADGLPRAGTNKAEVSVAGQRFTVSGTICMDQFVVDVGDLDVQVGDEVIVFGANGPTASEWAQACGTIGYEMTTRIGSRLAVSIDGGR